MRLKIFSPDDTDRELTQIMWSAFVKCYASEDDAIAACQRSSVSIMHYLNRPSNIVGTFRYPRKSSEPKALEVRQSHANANVVTHWTPPGLPASADSIQSFLIFGICSDVIMKNLACSLARRKRSSRNPSRTWSRRPKPSTASSLPPIVKQFAGPVTFVTLSSLLYLRLQACADGACVQ